MNIITNKNLNNMSCNKLKECQFYMGGLQGLGTKVSDNKNKGYSCYDNTNKKYLDENSVCPKNNCFCKLNSNATIWNSYWNSFKNKPT